MAKLVSTWSKDPSTQVGAVIVRPDKSVASVGFNGFPIGMPDNEKLYNDREEKYSRIIHAEMNALNFSQDASLAGYTLYSYPFLSCNRCYPQIVQAGITRIVAPICPVALEERWGDAFAKVRGYATEHIGITVDEVDYE